MPTRGISRVGHRAPDFNCEGIINGMVESKKTYSTIQVRIIILTGVARSLEYFVSKKQWLIILFLPATFSLLCPAEVL